MFFCISRRSKGLSKVDIADLERLTGLSKQELFMLYARFKRLAPNGYMTYSQFRTSMGIIGALSEDFVPQRLFTIFDQNGRGTLIFREFAEHLAIMLCGSPEAKMELSFRIGDKDEDGLISLDEFGCLVRGCHTMMRSVVPTDELGDMDDKRIEQLFYSMARHVNSQNEPVIVRADYWLAVNYNTSFRALLGLSGQTKESKNDVLEY